MNTEKQPKDLSRYSRQMNFDSIGEPGQRKLADARVLLVGCGALGCALANSLTRAGVGHLRIVDRDWVELTNLQRQTLFNESDAKHDVPKAIAAANHLRKVNSEIELEPHVVDLNFENVSALCEDVDLILDGTDNFEARFLINDASIKFSIPWVYGGCLGCEGQTMTIIPGQSACLNCLMLEGPPAPGTTATCDTAGIVEPIIGLISSIQAMEAIKILSGNQASVSPFLQVFDLWDNRHRQVDVSNLRDQVTCPTCVEQKFDWLEGRLGSQSSVLCGRNAVQLSFVDSQSVDLEQLESRLKDLGQVVRNPFLLKVQIEEFGLTVFPDGRAIVKGTEEVAVAKRIYAQYVGS